MCNVVGGCEQASATSVSGNWRFIPKVLDFLLSGALAGGLGVIHLVAARCDCAACRADWHKPEGPTVVRRSPPSGQVQRVWNQDLRWVLWPQSAPRLPADPYTSG